MFSLKSFLCFTFLKEPPFSSSETSDTQTIDFQSFFGDPFIQMMRLDTQADLTTDVVSPQECCGGGTSCLRTKKIRTLENDRTMVKLDVIHKRGTTKRRRYIRIKAQIGESCTDIDVERVNHIAAALSVCFLLSKDSDVHVRLHVKILLIHVDFTVFLDAAVRQLRHSQDQHRTYKGAPMVL